MPPRLQVTPDDEEQFDIFREHYFTRQRRKREEGEDLPNEKRRAERAIRKKKHEKSREEEKRKEGEQGMAEQLNQRVEGKGSPGKEKEQMAREGRESENSESAEVNKGGSEKRKTVLFSASSDDESQDPLANSQSATKIGQSKTITENVITDGAPLSVTTPLDASALDLYQRRSQKKNREGVSEVRSSAKKRKRAGASDDTVEGLEVAIATPVTKRTREHKDTPRPAIDVDSNASESEESLERMVRDTRRYLTLALNNLERIDFEERRLRNEKRKLLLEERRIIALENLAKENSK